MATSIITSIPGALETHLGRPPFDEPSITKAVVNFLFVKYGRSGENDLQLMFEACKLFLYLFNMWKFETPAVFAQRHRSLTSNHHQNELNSSDGGGESNEESMIEQDLLASYNISYHRWMCYNYVPSFCDSLDKHETIVIFGLPFLRLVFALVKHDIEDKFIGDKEKIPSDKRQIFCSYLPK